MVNALLYLPGERVRMSGVYEVMHASHRAPHEGLLWEDETFPRCQQCGGKVIFRLLRRVNEHIGEHISTVEGFERKPVPR